MRYFASERLKAIRLMAGMSQSKFATLCKLDLSRLNNIESRRVRVSEGEFAAIGELFPEFLVWLASEGDIDIVACRESKSSYSRIIAARVDIGEIPDGYCLEDRLILA